MLICIGLLLVLLAAHFGVNVWYLDQDNHVIRTDEETHMTTARDYYDTLFVQNHGTPMKFLIAVSKIRPSIPAHPPLLPIMGAFLAGGIGYSVDSFALVNTFMFMLLIVGVFCVAGLFMPPWGALLAAFIASFTPSLFHASRFFMTDYPATVIVVWSIYALLRSDYLRNPGWVFIFGLLNGAGIFFRITTFLYFLIPAAVVALMGIVRIFTASKDERYFEPGLRTWLLHCATIVVVSMAVFSPWYFHNLEPFYDYWMRQHAGGGGPLTITQEVIHEDKAEAPAAEPAQVPGKEVSLGPALVAAPEAAPAEEMKTVIKPWLPWHIYPIYLVNNNLFLVLALLSAGGAAIGLASGRFRSFPLILLLIWILGAYVIMTEFIKYANPRYALPVVPACAILAAIPFVALPRGWLRYASVLALAALLLFQYGNLTFTSYGPLARLQLPVELPRDAQDPDADPGLVLFKDEINYGYSYSGLGAVAVDNYQAWGEENTVRECNYKDRLFFAMINYEKTRQAAVGQDAQYIRLGGEMRGMELDERHFWKGSPYQRKDLPEDDLPHRRLRSTVMAPTLERMMPRLADADYVVYALLSDETEREAEWVAFLEGRGFERVDHFTIEPFGFVPARTYGVMARKEENLIVIKSEQDVADLDFFEVHGLLYSNAFAQLTPELRKFAEERFMKLLGEFPASQKVNDNITYIGTGITPRPDGNFQFRFVFRVDVPIIRSWRAYFHGRPPLESLQFLPEQYRAQGYQDWNFAPQPPTNVWPAGSYVVISNTIKPEPILYDLKLGFFSKEDGYFGSPIHIGQIDFGKLNR